MAGFDPGTTLAGYEIGQPLGRGGMGIVYRARQLDLDREVALKVILPEYAQEGDFRERFKRESRIAATIEHPNVIPVHQAGEEDGHLFIAMRLVEGRDLSAILSGGNALEPERAARLVAQVGAALDAAHAHGLVHRDVKPANVLIEETGGNEHAYLTDFGLTKHVASDSGLTATGQWVGTVDYIAPEQVQGKDVDARADVYALGCVLYQALTGTVPFPRDSMVAKIWAHVSDPPPPPTGTNQALPGVFDTVVARALAKDPDERYQSAGNLGRAAEAAARGELLPGDERTVARGAAAPRARRPGRRPLMLGAAALAAAGATAVALAVIGPGGDSGPSGSNRASGGQQVARGNPDSGGGAAAAPPVAASPDGSLPLTGAKPAGTLFTSGIGEVKVGMTAGEVEERFGKPDEKSETNLGGSGAAPQENWLWNFDDGALSFAFDTAGGRLRSYSVTTPMFKTHSGIRVGDAVAKLRRQHGAVLRDAPIGSGFLLSEGEPGTFPALTFGADQGKITSIGGGEPPPAGD